MTEQTFRILALFVVQPFHRWHSRAVSRETGLAKQTVDSTLQRLESERWLAKERERVDPALSSRPARQLYRITPQGQQQIAVLRGLLMGSTSPVLPGAAQALMAGSSGGSSTLMLAST